MSYTLTDVLHEVNNMRLYQFSLPPLRELPKAKQLCAEYCVIAKCFPNAYTDGSYLFWNAGAEIELPDLLVEFIMDFDNGEWPELIESPIRAIA